MGELRPGWRRLRFDEMVTSAGATRKARGWTAAAAGVDRYVGLEHLDADSPTIRRWGSPEDVGENSDLRPFEAGDVILARRGIEQRKVGFATFDGVASGHALVFRARPGVVIPAFLPYFLLSDAFMGRVDQFSAGSLSKTVNLTTLLRLEFALPPLDEQRRLSKVLSALNSASGALSDGLATLDGARDSAIAQVLESGLRRARVVRTTLGLRPENWDVLPMAERYDIQLGKMISEKTQGPGIRRQYLRNANVDWGRFELDDLLEMSLQEDEIERYEVRTGDILACEGRHVGKSAIWRGEVEGVCYQKALHRLRVRDPSRDLPEYLLLVLRHYYVSGRLIRHSTGTTIPHLPLANLRAIHVAFPPLDEQEEIVAFIDDLDSARDGLRRRQSAISNTQRSLLASMGGRS